MDSPSASTISCPSAKRCVVLDNSGVVTYDGTGWSGHTTLGLTTLKGLSCGTVKTCTVVDEDGNAFSHSGAWN